MLVNDALRCYSLFVGPGKPAAELRNLKFL